MPIALADSRPCARTRANGFRIGAAMSPQSLESRLERLEQRVTVLEQLPARIDGLTLQIVQLREEMHAAFSASATSLRAEIRAGDEETRRVLREEFRASIRGLRGELQATRDEVMGQARALGDDIMGQARTLHDDTMGQARTLHEDMKATLALIKEVLPRPRNKRR